MSASSIRCLRFIWITLLLSIAFSISAQELVINGKVRDANTHREIPNVNIYIKDLGIGTVSNAAGRFSMRVVRPEPAMMVMFQHVAYDTLYLMIEEVLSTNNINMQERVISIPVVQTESIESQLEIHKDLPQSVSVLDARIFDLHGYIDAGDLLRTDHSIQVDEEISGKKTVSIRGGSPDEVIVLYNGIKMNSNLDNIFDISLINLAEIERLEVIKGSNTTLYGSEGFSGVVNVIPRFQQDYNFRFQQQIGAYNTNNWGLHLFKDIGRMHAGYSVKKGEAERELAQSGEEVIEVLKNDSEHQTASLAYNLSETTAGVPTSTVGVMYNRSMVDYFNERDEETLSNFNQMVSTRFVGELFGVDQLNISGAYQWQEEDQYLRFFNLDSEDGYLTRNIDNSSWHFNANKSIDMEYFQVLLGYQFKNARLDFQDDRSYLNSSQNIFQSSDITRQNHGFVSIAKVKIPPRSSFLQRVNFDLSVRYDMVDDKQDNPAALNESNDEFGYTPIENAWRESMVKLSTHFSGNNGRFAFKGFLNVGSNVKFPTLLQQISTRELLSSAVEVPSLEAEKNRSVEMGLNLLHQVGRSDIYGWELSGNIFRNSYQNKFRSYYLPGTPIPVYDNVSEATLTGFEAKQSLYLFQKKMTMDVGASRYIFSDQPTFPFKHDRKYTINMRLNQYGYALHLHAYQEGEQIAQIRTTDGEFRETKIPKISNLDIHFSKSFEIDRVKLIFNASLRNALDDDFDLEGLILRERRYYLTLGIEY